LNLKCILSLIISACLFASCEKSGDTKSVEVKEIKADTESKNSAINEIEINETKKIEYESAQEQIFYNEEYLKYIAIEDGYSITGYAETIGEEYKYYVYAIENLEVDRAVYWEVIVLKDDKVISVLRQDLAEYSEAFPSASMLVLERDVNFDGKNDVLFRLGHFGSAIAYSCYLQDDGNFIECPSFAEIPNPAVDDEGKMILGSVRNSAVSNTYSIYHFVDGEYIQTERLTQDLINTENKEAITTWTEETFINGQWELREYLTDENYSEEEIKAKIYGENSIWGISQDRRSLLFNGVEIISIPKSTAFK